MTTPKDPPWRVARRLYRDTFGASTPKALDRAAIDWNGESGDYPGEPAAGDYHLHHLLFLNIQAQAEVAQRLDALHDLLKAEGAATRRGLGKLIQLAEWIHEAIPEGRDDTDDQEDDDEEDSEDEDDDSSDEEDEDEDEADDLDEDDSSDDDSANNRVTTSASATAAKPTPAPTPGPRGPRLLHRPTEGYAHPVAEEEDSHAS